MEILSNILLMTKSMVDAANGGTLGAYLFVIVLSMVRVVIPVFANPLYWNR